MLNGTNDIVTHKSQTVYQTVPINKYSEYKKERPGIEPVRALADISRSALRCIATKPVHRLQIRPIVHN